MDQDKTIEVRAITILCIKVSFLLPHSSRVRRIDKKKLEVYFNVLLQTFSNRLLCEKTTNRA